MKRTANDLYGELKTSSSPAGQKQKSKHRNQSKKLENMAPSSELRPLDMKSLRVLVERTKFNEMQVTDNFGNLKNNIRSVLNGEKIAKRGRKPKRSGVISSVVSSSSSIAHKTHLNNLFRIRRCYVRLSRDKELIRLQTPQSQLQLKQKQKTSDTSKKRSPGRPKKKKRGSSEANDNSKTTNATSHLNTVSTASGSSPAPAATATGISSSLKRKSTEASENSAPKRNRKQKATKGLEFFINIGALTRTPSPRRRLTGSIGSEEARRKGTKATNKPAAKKTTINTPPNTLTLRQQFGNRFFSSYVKIKRFNKTRASFRGELSSSSEIERKKNTKNRSVSFLETVEIFGESSDGEDWMDYDDFSPSHSAKGSRLKRLENGVIDDKQASTSTPGVYAGNRQNPLAVESNGSARKSGGILKRREKVSFSPLKEDECSPRKEQLKRANEKIVRLSLEQQPAEDDEREATDVDGYLLNASQTESNFRVPTVASAAEAAKETTLANQQPEPERETSAIALALDTKKEEEEEEENHVNDQNDIEQSEESRDKEQISNNDDTEHDSPNSRQVQSEETNTSSSMPIEPENQLITPPPSAERDECGESDHVPVSANEKPLIENVTPVNELDAQLSPTRVVDEKDKENDGSFQSALEASSPLPNVQDSIDESKQDKLSDFSEKLEFSQTTVEDDGFLAATTERDEFTLPQAESTSIEAIASDSVDEQLLPHEAMTNDMHVDDNEAIPEPDNQVNNSNSSEQEQFEDASSLVATVLLSPNSPTTDDDAADHTETVAVLNQLSHIAVVAAGENVVLLNETNHLEADVEYDTRSDDHTIHNQVDNDFVASVVLTHPEVESTLNATVAETLVPNSQEIVVVESVGSQAVAGVSAADVEVTEDTFASVVAEVERLSKDVNEEMYTNNVGITGADVMMDNVQANNSLDDIFNDDDGQSHMFLQFPDDIISSLRMSSGAMDIGHDKSLPIQVIETEVMAIPNEPDLIFDKPIGTTASILGTSMSTTPDSLAGHHHHHHHHHHYSHSKSETPSKLSIGRIFQSVKSYVMSPGGEKTSAMQD